MSRIFFLKASAHRNISDAIQMEVVASFFVNYEATGRVQHSNGADIYAAIEQVADQHDNYQCRNGATNR